EGQSGGCVDDFRDAHRGVQRNCADEQESFRGRDFDSSDCGWEDYGYVERVGHAGIAEEDWGACHCGESEREGTRGDLGVRRRCGQKYLISEIRIRSES